MPRLGPLPRWKGDVVHLHTFMADPEGTHVAHRQIVGPPEQTLALAQRIAADLVKAVGG